jgi:putative oxidoreductase
MSTFVSSRIAKYIFAVVMATFGILHFVYGQGMTSMVPAWMPFEPIYWVYFTGAALIAYGIAVLINNKYQKIAGYLLAVMFFLFVILVHMPQMNTNTMALPLMLKDIAMAFAAIFIANSMDEED